MDSEVSRPTRSSSASGPIGKLQPPFMAVSMSSRSAVPFSSIRTALLRYGNSRALTMNPARSLTSTASLPQASAKALASATVSSEAVSGPDDLDQAHHRRRVEEVDAARPGRGGRSPWPSRSPAASRCWWRGWRRPCTMPSSSRKSAFFTSRSSTTDSMTRSQSASACRSSVAVTRARIRRRRRPRACPCRPAWRATSRARRPWRRPSSCLRTRSTTSMPGLGRHLGDARSHDPRTDDPDTL